VALPPIVGNKQVELEVKSVQEVISCVRKKKKDIKSKQIEKRTIHNALTFCTRENGAFICRCGRLFMSSEEVDFKSLRRWITISAKSN